MPSIFHSVSPEARDVPNQKTLCLISPLVGFLFGKESLLFHYDRLCYIPCVTEVDITNENMSITRHCCVNTK